MKIMLENSDLSDSFFGTPQNDPNKDYSRRLLIFEKRGGPERALKRRKWVLFLSGRRPFGALRQVFWEINHFKGSSNNM